MQERSSKSFREYLLNNVIITRVVELSSVRKLVFKHADAPAMILSYRFSNANVLENRFQYISMKPNIFFRLFNLIVIEKSDIKYVEQKLLAVNDWAWKTLVYGLSGDVDLNRLEVFDKNSVHRPRNPELYQAPYCLLLTGLDMADFTMRSVYSESSFIYKAVVYGIKAKAEQKHILLNLTGLFNSSLFSYFNLMLGSFAGIECEKRLVEEVLDFPHIYSDEIASQVEYIQKLSNNAYFSIEADISEAVRKLNEMILESYHLDNNEFINYALNIQIPQLVDTHNNQIYRPVDASDLEIYSKPFFEYLSAVFLHSKKYVSLNIYPQIAKHYSAIEVVLQDQQPQNQIHVINNSSTTKEILTKFSAHKINDLFFELKDVIYFEEDSFYIIKTNQYKNWHPAIAQLDLMEVVDQILSRSGGDC